MKLLKNILKFKIIFIVAIVCLIVILISSLIFHLKFTDGSYNEGDESNVPYMVDEYINGITVDEDGLHAKDDMTVQDLWNTLVANESNVAKYLENSDQLKQLIQAQIITQFPYIDGATTELNGCVKIEKHAKGEDTKTLKYKNKEAFDKLVDENKEKATKFFTMDDNKNIIYAYSTGDGTISTQKIGYQSVVQKYTMPFQYLWSFLVVGENVDFVLELAELANDSEITIGIFDSTTTITTYDTVKTTTTRYYQDGTVFSVEENSYTTQPSTTVENNPVVDIIKANTWIIDYSKDYEYGDDEVTFDGDGETSTESVTYTDVVIGQDEEGNDILGTMIVNIDTTPHTTITQQSLSSTETSKYKVEKDDDENNFVKILSKAKYENLKNTYTEVTDEESNWLLQLLSRNPDTVNMVDLTKYLFNKVLGTDAFDVNDFDLDSYNLNDFSSTTSIVGSDFEEKIWFALINAGFSKEAAAGAMGNFYQESGVRSNNLQNSYEDSLGSDEEYTKKVNDGTYTNFAGDSAGYGLCQWTSSGRKKGLLNYSKNKGVGIDDQDMQIEFMLAELGVSTSASSYASNQLLSYNGYSGKDWKNATTPEDAAVAFCWSFERPGKPELENRKKKAREYYEKYKDQEAPTGSVDYGEINLSNESKQKMINLLNEAVRIANDDRYLYSQSRRMEEFYYDCSSFVYRLYKKFFDIKTPTSTWKYGNSNKVGSASSTTLKPGDVLWRSGHVTLYLGNGQYAAAHGQNYSEADQITVYQDSPSNYTYVYRFITK